MVFSEEQYCRYNAYVWDWIDQNSSIDGILNNLFTHVIYYYQLPIADDEKERFISDFYNTLDCKIYIDKDIDKFLYVFLENIILSFDVSFGKDYDDLIRYWFNTQKRENRIWLMPEEWIVRNYSIY